jgi:hypothetical protein
LIFMAVSPWGVSPERIRIIIMIQAINSLQ